MEADGPILLGQLVRQALAARQTVRACPSLHILMLSQAPEKYTVIIESLRSSIRESESGEVSVRIQFRF
jgi:hypothetical protein